MKNSHKTKIQLIKELDDARERIAELEGPTSNRTILEDIDEGYFEVDLSGNFTFVNDAECRDLGYSREELIGMNYRRYSDKATAKRIFESFLSIYQTGTPIKGFPGQYISKDGRRHFNEVSASLIRDAEGKPVGFRGISRDITERKRIEQSLIENEVRLRTLLQTIPDLIWLKNPDGAYLACNRMFERFFGARETDILGKTDYDFMDKELAEFFREHDRKAIESGKPCSNEEWLTFRDNGYQGLFDTIKTPMFDAEGKLIGVLGIARDITGRKESEKTLQREQSFTKAVLDSLPGIFYLYSYPELRLVRWNKNHEALLGFGPGEINNRHIMEWHIPEAKEAVLQAVEMVMQKGQNIIESILLTKDGHSVPFLMTGVRFEVQGASYLMGVGFDISDRKRAEQALLERDALFAKISSQVPGMLYQFMRKPDGTYSVPFSSQGIYDIFGCMPEAVRNDFEPILSVILPEDRGRLIQTIDESMRNLSPWTCEYRVQLPDQPIRWLMGNSIPEKMADGVIVWSGYNTDITERKQADEALREKEMQYRQLIDQAADGIFVLDVDGGFLLVNSKCCELLGYSADELYHLNIIDTYPDEARDFGWKRLALLKSGEPLRFERLMKRKDGSLFIVEASALKLENGRLQAIIHDITERKQTETALRESEERYRLITDNISDIILTSDISGNYTFITSSHKRVLGRGEEVLGRSIFEHIHPEDIPRVMATFEESMKSGQAGGAEFRYLHPSRDYIWLESQGMVIDMQGTPTGVIVSRDITGRKQAEESLRKSEERFQQAHKMEAIGTLAGGIAHDFNNILAAILGYAELATMSHHDGQRFDHYLEEIIKAGVRARELVRQILTFSRQSGIKREPMEMAPMVKETLKFLKASLPATIDIKQELQARDSMVVADPTQIHQIIMNLCTNAAHAMQEKGGVLHVRLAEVDVDDEAKLLLEGLNGGRYIQLAVSDTGVGIPRNIITKIFDPFFTTKGRGEGTGMGLAVVHGIVKDIGGAISVNSEPGQGTTFHVLLPKHEGKSIGRPVDSPISKTGSGRILFVDDEELIIDSGRGILEYLGYKVVSTTNPLEALRLFGSNPEAFDLVLTDMTMPKMTGLELSEQLLLIRPDIPIILSTGFSLAITAETVARTGIKAFVMKPMIASELAKAVYSVLNPDSD